MFVKIRILGDCDEIGLYICELSRSFMIEHILLKNGFWNFNLKFWKGNSYQYDDVKIFDTSVLVVDTSSLNSEFYSMSSKEKKRIRNFWIKALPFLINVEYLMTTHQIDQEFFDAIIHAIGEESPDCQHRLIERLRLVQGESAARGF